jgi:hypothetical protein
MNKKDEDKDPKKSNFYKTSSVTEINLQKFAKTTEKSSTKNEKRK